MLLSFAWRFGSGSLNLDLRPCLQCRCGLHCIYEAAKADDLVGMLGEVAEHCHDAWAQSHSHLQTGHWSTDWLIGI
jgi:hypothetical protein